MSKSRRMSSHNKLGHFYQTDQPNTCILDATTTGVGDNFKNHLALPPTRMANVKISVSKLGTDSLVPNTILNAGFVHSLLCQYSANCENSVAIIRPL
jgi:hypothetical protein